MSKLPVLIIFVPILTFSRHSVGVRVCKSFPEYYDVVFNKGCYDNPYSRWSQLEIIGSWGFTAEEYIAKTEDGYLINVVRGYQTISKKNPVLLAHGFINNAYSWIGKGNTSLAYLLGKSGFDVWIVNWRGTKQSRGHRTLSDSQKAYWKFSFDEMAKYDLPAVLNKITEVTGVQKTIYIGFSMGCNIGYIYSIDYPQMAREKIERLITIAPAAYLIDIKSAAKLIIPIAPILKLIPFFNLHGQVFPFLAIGLLKYVCDNTPGTLITCEFFKSLMVGFNFQQLDPQGVPIFDATYFDATSYNTFAQFMQLITRKKFEAYDFGKKKNLEKYGREGPKIYNISKINVPVTIYAGANDYLVLVKNARKLYDELQTQYQCGFHVVSDKRFTHYSVTEAKNAQDVLYPLVVDAANGGKESKCESR